MRLRSWQRTVAVGVPATDHSNWALTCPGFFVPAFEFRFALFRLGLFLQFTVVSQKVHERTGIRERDEIVGWGYDEESAIRIAQALNRAKAVARARLLGPRDNGTSRCEYTMRRKR